MASPQSGGDTATAKLAKDRNCPFCGQAFTSSSLGRHLDLYIKPKAPKAPDGVHDVEEIRKMRGNITRRQSRVASIKRDSSVPAGPASARYSFDERTASTPDSSRRVGWSVNKPGWEATGVMNDLPPRIEPRPADRRESSRRDQLKVDLDQRQNLADELDTGRAAQLALKEILDTVRNAEASATGRHLFDDFDFFQQSFPALCLRLLSPLTSYDSAHAISPNDGWSSSLPWEQQRDALSRVVDERGQQLRRKDSLLSPTYEEASAASLNLDKFHQHIHHVFELWKNVPDRSRAEIWQRDIVRSYARMELELKEAKATISELKRDAKLLTRRLGRASSTLSPVHSRYDDVGPSIPYAQSPVVMSDDALRDLHRQGLSTREWNYERLLDRWKNVVREERRSNSGLQAQRHLSAPSHFATNPSAALSANGAATSIVSRSASVASAMSAAGPTRTASLDSAAGDADAEGEEEDMEADNVAPDAHMYTRKPHEQESTQYQHGEQSKHGQPSHVAQHVPNPPQAGDASNSHAHVDQHYKWPQTTPGPAYQTIPEPGTMRRLPPGPESWHAEFHHAVSHSMEGVEGPATANSSVTAG